MSKTAEMTEIRINTAVPVAGFRRRMFFNRFSLEKISDNVVLASFAIIDSSGLVRDWYPIVFTHQTLEDSKANLKSLLEKIGQPTASISKWSPPTAPTTIDMATVVNAGVSLDAELIFSALPIGPAYGKSVREPKDPIELDAIAFLRCDPELLKLFIVELYTLCGL